MTNQAARLFKVFLFNIVINQLRCVVSVIIPGYQKPGCVRNLPHNSDAASLRRLSTSAGLSRGHSPGRHAQRKCPFPETENSRDSRKRRQQGCFKDLNQIRLHSTFVLKKKKKKKVLKRFQRHFRVETAGLLHGRGGNAGNDEGGQQWSHTFLQ